MHACRTCYRKAVSDGYDTQADRPNCLVLEDGHHLYMDLIDWPRPEFEIEIFAEFFRFVDSHIKGCEVLIHCNKAESRSPSLTLLYMAKRLGLLPNESYDIAAGCFQQRFPYSPGQGISSWLRDSWHLLDFPEQTRGRSDILYHFDPTESPLPRDLVIQLAGVPPEVDARERNLL